MAKKARTADRIQDVIQEHLRAIPRLMLEKVLEKKLKEASVAAPPTAIKALSESILAGKKTIHIDGIDDDVSIEIDDEDMKFVVDATKAFYVEHLPAVLQKTASSTARDLLKELKRRWREEHLAQQADVAGFRDRMEQRWGKGLNLLRILITIVREWSENAYRHRRRQKSSHLSNALMRLHVRACQIVSEIIVLLENGYADGAIARWRTLHELTVVAGVLAKHGEDIAERYVLYQFVESHIAQKRYEQDRIELGFKQTSPAQARKVLKEYQDVLRRFGPAFGKEYGWAAHHLGASKNDRLTFARLEKEMDRSYMRSPYKMASYNVHASPKGAYFRLGNIDGQPTLLAGASNAGLTEPAQHTVYSFVQLTILAIGKSRRFDDLVMAQLLLRFQKLIPDEFWKAEKKLRRDDRKYRRSPKKAQ